MHSENKGFSLMHDEYFSHSNKTGEPTNNNARRVMRKLPIIIIVALIGLYLILFIDTNSVVRNAKDIMTGDAIGVVTDGTPLHRYNIKSDFPDSTIEAEITRLFVLHDFLDGYIWVKYYYKATSSSNDYILSGAGPLVSRWKIHRVKGRWEIVEIDEKP